VGVEIDSWPPLGSARVAAGHAASVVTAGTQTLKADTTTIPVHHGAGSRRYQDVRCDPGLGENLGIESKPVAAASTRISIRMAMADIEVDAETHDWAPMANCSPARRRKRADGQRHFLF
jgi:hypothetical protein